MPRTSLDDFALDILDLVGKKLEEAHTQRQSRRGALTEAACGMKILRNRIIDEDATKSAQLMLVFDVDLEELEKLGDSEFDKGICDVLKALEAAKGIFSMANQN